LLEDVRKYATLLTSKAPWIMMAFEAKLYPFVLMSIRGNGYADSEYCAMIEAIEAVARKALLEKTKHVLISVSSGSMSPRERQFVAKRLDAAPKELASVVLNTYVISSSATFRGVLTALRWVVPTLMNFEAVASVEAAMTAAAATFERHGIEVDGVTARGARYWLEKQVTLSNEETTVSR
jgi:hypothetical protein